jgi:hypothetical protein
MKQIQLSFEVKNLGDTYVIYFFLNGKMFCSVPARTTYNEDTAEDLAETVIANVLTEQIRETARYMGLADG